MRRQHQTIRIILNFVDALFFALGCILLLPLGLTPVDGEIWQEDHTFLAFLLPAAISFIIPRGESSVQGNETVCLVFNSQHAKEVADFLTRTR